MGLYTRSLKMESHRSTAELKVAVVEDLEHIREGLRVLIGGTPGYRPRLRERWSRCFKQRGPLPSRKKS